jgi:hypothetical protein
MVRPLSARPTRRTGSLALAVERDGAEYVLNTGGAYGGEYHLTGAIRLRTRRGTDELVMLREHDRTRIVGAWTGARVDGRRVVASGLRWAETPDAQEARALVDGGFLSAASIGFSGRWRYRDEMKPDDLAAMQAEGADLTRLQYVIDDVEVYEASLVAVGADEGARWAMDGEADEGEDGGLTEAQRLMIRHLTAHHDFTEADAVVEVLGPVLDTEDPPAEPDEAAADDAPAESDDGALYDVPSEVRAAAQQGLDWREKYGRGGTASGVRTARALTSGRVTPELVITIAAWWARFAEVEGPMEDGGEPTALAIARALWGGDTARGWADGLADDARAEVEGEAALSAAAAPAVSESLSAWWAQRPAPPSPLAAWWTGTATSHTPSR